MVIRKKSREQLNGQARWFLDHSEDLWLITNDKKREILDVLRDDSVDISDKAELKSKLNWIVSDKEFDWLYWEYVDYNKDEISKIKNFLKEVNVFPSGYEFLADDLALSLVRDWTSFDSMKDDLLFELDKFREIFERNIVFLKEKIGIDNKSLWKFILFIVSIVDDYDAVEKNINLFRSAWIHSFDDLSKLCSAFSYDDGSDVIELLVKSWIKIADDFLKLENLVRSRYYKNLKLFVDAWIKTADDLLKLDYFITSNRIETSQAIELFKNIWIKTADDFLELSNFITSSFPWNIELFIDAWIRSIDDFLKLKDIILKRLSWFQISKVKILSDAWIKTADDFLKLKDVILSWCYENLDVILNSCKNGNEKITADDVLKLGQFISYWNGYCLKNLEFFWDLCCKSVDDFLVLESIIKWPSLSENEISIINILSRAWIKKAEDFAKLRNVIYHWNVKNLTKIVDIIDVDSQWDLWVDDILRLDSLMYDPEFQNCLDSKSINWNSVKFMSRWFKVSWPELKDDTWILNDSISLIYPNLNLKFNDDEAQQILWFIDRLWWVNKWYTILILTMEKMVRDWVSVENFKNELFNKLDEYKSFFDQYPEDKVPDWLKISVWIELEMTRLFSSWYESITWKNYKTVVSSIAEKAKVWSENEWAFEFAIKPSTNPMVALLEVYLLQELNLLDLNDMQKLSWKSDWINYKSRNGTWYHLNIWSDADIWIDGNIQFIQNLCTLLPWAWICNWDNVSKINPQSNINSKTSKFSVFPNRGMSKYVEFRTYSVDNAELFGKNVLFNVYAVMWSQAEKKVSMGIIQNQDVISKLLDDETISDSNLLLDYFEKNNLFIDHQDLKSKKIASEFLFMKLCVLRAIRDYNKNFIDNELFWMNLVQNLTEPRKKCFFDILLLDKKETFWFWNEWYSSMVVKRFTNLTDNFDFTKYLNKSEPFSDDESIKILNEFWNDIDEKWIPYVTIWLNKQLLWFLLSDWVEKTQDLQDQINNRMSNIDRIKSYIKKNEKNQGLRIDSQYLYDYFNDKLSLDNFDPYDWINLKFMNKIINLNNFFLKNDDTNANWVLQKTINDWKEEDDISKLSLFETWWEIRKWYNYYQWWSADMLLHKTQTIAINYMENVQNILNNDFISESSVDPEFKLAA